MYQYLMMCMIQLEDSLMKMVHHINIMVIGHGSILIIMNVMMKMV